MTAIEAQDLVETRRRHLTTLADELGRLGLGCRLLGPAESVLRVVGGSTGRRVMVLASPTTEGWSFLWTGGGIADAADPGTAAHQIATTVADGPAGQPATSADAGITPGNVDPDVGV